MELSLAIDIHGALEELDHIDRAAEDANDAAMKDAGAVAVAAIRSNVSYRGHPAPLGQLGSRSGRLFGQVRGKIFRARGNGLMGIAVKVIGDRSYIMGFNEFGTRTHGGRRPKALQSRRRLKLKVGSRGDHGPLPSRHVFARTYEAHSSLIIKTYLESFEQHFKSSMPAAGAA